MKKNILIIFLLIAITVSLTFNFLQAQQVKKCRNNIINKLEKAVLIKGGTANAQHHKERLIKKHQDTLKQANDSIPAPAP